MSGLTEYMHERLESLSGQRDRLKKYLLDCFAEADWHGVQDAASDLRELDREWTTLTKVGEVHGDGEER